MIKSIPVTPITVTSAQTWEAYTKMTEAEQKALDNLIVEITRAAKIAVNTSARFLSDTTISYEERNNAMALVSMLKQQLNETVLEAAARPVECVVMTV